MAKQIRNTDLFAADLFRKTQEDIKILIKELDLLEKGLISVATTQQKVLNNQDNTTLTSIQKTKTATVKLSEAEKQATVIRKEKLKLESAISRGRKKASLENQKLNQILIEERKNTKQLAKEQVGLVGAYEKEARTLNKLRKQYKNLAVSEKEVSKEQKALLRQIQTLDTKLKKVDKTVGQSQRNVGNYSSAWQRLGGIFKGGLGVLGVTAGLAGISKIFTSTIGIFSSFEKANSGLQAVLGVTKAEMVGLIEDSKRLGSITSFTAAEVTGLQTSFARLGFPTESIIQMTESTLNAAAAMGSGLDETAALTGATLKAFGLDASEAQRVNDVLAKSTSASALDFGKLSSAMSTIAPVANSFGFSVEGTTALLGQLSNAGFDASSSATATKNILLNLADSNGKLAKSLKEPVTDLPSLVAGLKQLKGEGIDLGEALQLTDKRSVAAFSTFLNGADDVLALNNELENAGGTAQAMADTQLDNLSGSVTILNSAWEGFVLSLEDGNGAFSRVLRNAVDLLTEILSLLTGTEKLRSEMTAHEKTVRKYAKAFISVFKIVSSLVVAFVAYKAVMSVTNAITKAYTVTTNALKVAQAFLTGGTKGATAAQKGLNAAMKANPIGLLITLVAGLVTAYLLFRDTATSAAKAQIAFNKQLAIANKVSQERIESQQAQTTESVRLLEEEIRARKIAGGDEEKLDREFIERKNELLAADVKFNEGIIEASKKRATEEKGLLKDELANIDKRIEATQVSSDFTGKGQEAVRQSVIAKLRQDRQKILDEAAKIAASLTAIKGKTSDEIDRINKLIITSEIDLTEATKAESEKQKKIGEKRAKELDLLRRKLEDLNNQAIEDNFDRRTAILQTQFKREIAAIKGFSKVEIALRIALQNKLDNDLIKLNESFNEKRDKLARNAIEDDTERAIANEIAKSEAIIDTINSTFPKESAEKERLIKAENDRLARAQDALLDKQAQKRLKANLDDIKKEADLQKALFRQKKSGFKTEEAFEKEKVAVFEAIDKKALEDELKLIEFQTDEKSLLRKEEIKAQIEDFSKFKETSKELQEVFGEAIGAIGDFVDEAFEKRLAAIDKTLNKVGQRIDQLRGKATEGRLEAEESLAFEQKREAELERQRERTRKRQAKAKAFFAVLTAFNENDGNLGKTITDISVLKGLASGFTAYDGVDDTGGRGKVDSKGGKLWTLHPNEQVWSKKDRSEVGFRNREDIKDIVKFYDNGAMEGMMKYDASNQFVNPSSFVLNGMSTGKIESKLDSLNESVRNIKLPQKDFTFDEVKGIIKMRERVGNKSKITVSKLRR